jgi:hypothetical protein
MFRESLRPSSGVLKTVTATSGIGHNLGAAASFHRGLISILLDRMRKNTANPFILGSFHAEN